MKKAVLLISLASAICLSLYNSYTKDEVSSKVNQLALDNVEALARDEGVNFFCIDVGDIECHGMKVYFMAEGLSVE